LAGIQSLAPKIGGVPQTLNEWVKRAEIDKGARAGVTTTDLQRLKELERERPCALFTQGAFDQRFLEGRRYVMDGSALIGQRQTGR